MTAGLHILFEDNHCVVVNKPAPLLTQGPSNTPSLEAMVKAYVKERFNKPGRVYLGIPHRLDRPVSGVILFARNSKAAQRLAEQFEKRQVTKTYWGVVEGRLEQPDGAWQDWIRKIKEEARSERADEGGEGARLAVLRYRCLRQLPESALVEFTPETGRMHQIRLQTSLRGHPIIGDRLYGASRTFGAEALLPRDRLIALHARTLTFLHPISYEPMTVTAPLPAVWLDYFADEIDLAEVEQLK